MRNRKITDGARSSARQKSKPYPADEEAEICRSTKTVCLASTHKVEKRPSKQTKCGRNSLAKLEMEGLITKGKEASFQKRPTETRNSLQRLDETPDNSMISRSVGRRIPTGHAEDAIAKENCDAVGTHCLQKRGDLRQLVVREESCQSNSSNIPTMEDSADGHSFPNESRGATWAQQKATLQLDSSVFIDEDSNQPMPLTRFFENADIMQEIPPVVPAYPSMSRREFRQLHFKAKEDIDDEDDDDEEDDDDDDDEEN